MVWVELLIYFEPESNKNRVGKRKVICEIFSEAEMLRPIKIYLFEISWVTVEVSRGHFLLHREFMGL